MKTYKTWEVIKMLTENPKLKFRNEHGVTFIFKPSEKDEYEYDFRCESGSYLSIPGVLKKDEWTLVKEPVDFMTAFNSDKEIVPMEGQFKPGRVVDWVFRFPNLTQRKFMELINGKWYIQEDEE